MALRPATPEEAQAAMGGLRPATPEELEDFRSRTLTPQFKTFTTQPTQRAEGPTVVMSREPGLTERVVSRFLGTDVDDPLEMERIGSVAVGAIGGAKAGGSAGAVLGPVGAAAGAVIGGVSGAAAGAAVPEQTLEFMEFMGLLPSGAREERGLSDEDMRRVMTGEALLETAFFGLAGAGRATARLAGRRLAGVTKESTRLAEAAAKEGIDLPPSVVGESGVGKMIVNVLGRFPVLGTSARRAADAAEIALREATEAMPDRIAPLVSQSSLGQRIFKDFESLFRETADAFSARYDDLFLQARRAGVTVVPVNAREAASGVLRSITENTPKLQEGVAGGGQALKYVREFLNENIVKLADDQSLAQMDEVIAKIDEAVTAAPQEIRGRVHKLLAPVKGAAKADVLQNMQGEGSREISEQLARLDSDFSETMAFMFETSTAKRIEQVRARGIKGVVRPSERATQVPVDRLANIVIDTNSPQAIDELSRMVSPDTFRQVGARVLSDALERAMTVTDKGTTVLRPETFSRVLGLGEKASAKGEATARLLKDTDLTIDHLRQMAEVMRRMSNAPVPNVSTFIARRAGIGGFKSVVRGMLPFLAISGGASAVNPVAGLFFVLGGRAMVKVVSDPANARALSKVLGSEVARVQKRAAALVLLRSGISALEEQGSIGEEGTETPAEAATRTKQQAADDVKGITTEAGRKLFQFGQELFKAISEQAEQ